MSEVKQLSALNVSELVEQFKSLSTSGYYPQYRWRLHNNTEVVWLDRAAGVTWFNAVEQVYNAAYELYDAAPDIYEPQATSAHQAGERAEEAYKATHPRPPETRVTRWWLEGNKHTPNIVLSVELGEALSKDWKVREEGYRHDYTYKTPDGIVKMLSTSSNFKSFVADAQRAAVLRDEMLRRNNARRNILAKCKELEELVTRQGACIGVTVEMFAFSEDLNVLLAIESEETK
jgi:hypothetical protein